MKIVLLKNLENLGSEGDLVEVKDGYGRNYLIPKKLALPATKVNLKKIDGLKKEKAKQQEKEKQSLLGLRDKIDNLSLTIATEAKEDETLYGNIKETQILKLLSEEENIDLSKGKINIEGPIDKLGVYKIPVQISKGIEATLRLWVVKK